MVVSVRFGVAGRVVLMGAISVHVARSSKVLGHISYTYRHESNVQQGETRSTKEKRPIDRDKHAERLAVVQLPI